MSCDCVVKLIPLYFYGELPPEEEERVEEHLHGCAVCAREMERQRQLAAALDRRQAEPPPLLLEECRAGLMAAIQSRAQGASPQGAVASKGPWSLFLEAMAATLTGFHRFRQPVGALALVALGFFAARFTGMNPSVAQAPGLSPSGEVYSTVRSIQPDNAGRVRIAFDETRRREVSGSMDDQGIQRLLLAAAHESNPAMRVESVGLLKEQAGSSEVRDALLNALLHDSNAGVRMKALAGLKPLAGDPEVRKTLAGALVSDENPAVRMQAVDLLVTHRDDAMVGVLQGLVQRESNDYVRLKCEKALKDWNASVGTF
jgi:anti-sigma factor RsiW